MSFSGNTLILISENTPLLIKIVKSEIVKSDIH